MKLLNRSLIQVVVIQVPPLQVTRADLLVLPPHMVLHLDQRDPTVHPDQPARLGHPPIISHIRQTVIAMLIAMTTTLLHLTQAVPTPLGQRTVIRLQPSPSLLLPGKQHQQRQPITTQSRVTIQQFQVRFSETGMIARTMFIDRKVCRS